jgi:hypothetical protein
LPRQRFFVRSYWKPYKQITEETKEYGVLALEVRFEWVLWRLVMAKVATLEELRTTYSLADVLKLNSLLDMKEDIERCVTEEAERASKR